MAVSKNQYPSRTRCDFSILPEITIPKVQPPPSGPTQDNPIGKAPIRPVPGKPYVVVEGDSLSKIAGLAYGDIFKWPLINNANLTVLKTADPDLIFPGEVIWIPLVVGEQFKNTLPNTPADKMTVIVDGIEIPINSGRIIRTINSASDAWVCDFPWTPGEDINLDVISTPYQYPLASAYVGGVLQVGGVMYSVGPTFDTGGRAQSMEGFSFTIDAVDSNLKPPYEVNNVTLKQRAKDLLNPLGIDVLFSDAIDPRAGLLGSIAFTPEFKAKIEASQGGGKFDRVTASPNDTIFSHLASLAAQRGFLMSSDPQGNMVFVRANVNGKSIGTIEENESTFTEEYVAKFDGRKRFNAYKVISQTPGSTGSMAVAKDYQVSRPRFKNIQARDILAGEIKAYAEWERNKILAEAYKMRFPVSTWYGPDGELWSPNTIVTLVSPTLHIPQGIDLLIQQVEFIYGSGGISAMLSLVPPEVYSKEAIVEPWG